MKQGRIYYAHFPAAHYEWYQANCCPACGRFNGTGQVCENVRKCLICGKNYCGINSVCRDKSCEGWLEGYYHRNRFCGYKNCTEHAVRDWPRVGQICFKHLKEKQNAGKK